MTKYKIFYLIEGGKAGITDENSTVVFAESPEEAFKKFDEISKEGVYVDRAVELND